MSAGKFFLVLSIGAAAGAAVAFLYAPQSGEKTRRQLRRRMEDAGDRIRDTVETIGDQAGKCAKRGKSLMEDAKDTAQFAYGAAKKVVSM